jgi:osmotically-inducible protein OsmY
MLGYLIAGAAGLAAMYLLDPDRGKRRRSLLRDRTAAAARRLGAVTERTQRKLAADAYGVGQKLSHPAARQDEPANDAALAQKVMTELFRDPDFMKGSVNVNAENGVVQLRGTVERPELALEIEGRVRRIAGVLDVENFLHLADTEAQKA